MSLAAPSFDVELDYFINNQEDLVRRHAGKLLVLVGESVEGVYDSVREARVDGDERFGAGHFMIQPCEPGRGAYTVFVRPPSFLGARSTS